MHDPTTSSSSTIRVAILGGGLGGAALLKGLLKHPHIAADLYESRPPAPGPGPAPTLRDEAGPAIELSAASLAALRLIDPSWNLDLDGRLARAGALLATTEVRLASGPRAGQRVSAGVGAGAEAGSCKTVVGRQALLAELAAGLPPCAVHFNTRVTAIREVDGSGSSADSGGGGGGGGGLVVVFGDGSQKRYDVVIGADRILGGAARKHVLLGGGGSAAANRSRPTGFWGLHVTVPLERAQSFLGEMEPNGASTSPTTAGAAQQPEVRWVGDGTFMQHGLVNGGRDVQVVAYARLRGSGGGGYNGDTANSGGEESPTWVKLFTPDEFEAMFAGCRPAVCKGIIKLFQSIYTVHIPGLLEMRTDDGGDLPNTNTTPATMRCTTLLAPATMTTPPFPSPSPTSTTSTALAIEEALVLSTLLGAAGPCLSGLGATTTATTVIPAALYAFETVCRPRAQRAARLACETTALLAGCAPGVGLDAGRLAGVLEGSVEGGSGGDGDGGVQARLAAAVEVMEQQLFLMGRRG